MCVGNKCQQICPAAKLATFIPPEKPCGKPPETLFPGLFKLVRENGEFLPPVTRAIGGKMLENA